MKSEKYDVIVFGGGVSGLSSAYKLLEKNPNLSILVLEARDRVGGRTYSIKKGTATIELGGQWFGPHHKKALELMNKLEIELIEQYDTGLHLFQGDDGKVETYDDNNDPYKPLKNLVNKLETMAYNLSKEGLENGKWDTEEKDMDQISLATWLQENSFRNESDKLGSDILTKVFNSAIGAEPEEYSLLFFLHMLRACVGYKEIMEIKDCAQHWKTVEGSQQISLRLEKIINSHNKCRVLKNAPVTSVIKKNSIYIVETNNKQVFYSTYCICSVPLHLQNKINFEPPLPFHRAQLSMRSPMGSIVKITVQYDTAFWKEKGYSGLVLSLSYPSSYIIDASGKNGKNPALLCFINGKCAREFSLLDEQNKTEMVIKQLVSIFGEDARNYTGYIEQNWLKETYSSGCYFNVPSVGVISNFGYILRAPFGNIHFAGSETATEWFGYIEGALESGYRCAEEIYKKILNSPKL